MNLLDEIASYGGRSLRKLDKTAMYCTEFDLLAQISHYGYKRPSKEVLEATTAELEEGILMSSTAAKLMASGECGSVDELIKRTCAEGILLGIVLEYIERKTGLVLPDDSPDPPMLLPVVAKLLAEGKCASFDELINRLAVIVLNAHNAGASAAENDPLLS